jgi:hypothetical protein
MKRLLLLFVVVSASACFAHAQSNCDRKCLQGIVTQYLDAMVAHKPDSLPTAPNVRFTEDTQVLKLGEGLWKNASKIRAYRQDFLDVRQGVAVSHVIAEEAGMPVMLALRLKVENNKITEVETLVTRNREQGAIFNLDGLQTPRPEMGMELTPAMRTPRQELIRIAEFYPRGLKPGGTFAVVDAPFAPDAYRLENGQYMAGPGARAGSENIKTQSIIAHPDITYAVWAVDEELGVVVLHMDFGNTGDRYGAGNALVVSEAFKVYGGQIHAVEAFMRVLKAGLPTGFPYEMKQPK